MKKRNNLFLKNFEDRMSLASNGERIWFWCGFALLLIYLEVVVFLQNVFFGTTSPLFLAVCALAAVPLCFAGVACCRKMNITPSANLPTARGGILTAAAGFVLTLSVMLVAQTAFFPGSFANDNIVQLQQVYAGRYNNWHPVLHTWLFFALPLKLVPQHWFIITLQLIWFSVAVSYFLYVLYTSRCPLWFMVLAWFYTVLNPNSIDMMLHPLKDSAMNIFCLVLFSQLIRIYLSRGQWLKKPVHIAVFSLFAFLCSGMRHNAVLLIAPVFLFLFLFFRPVRRQISISAGLVLALVLLWQNAVLPLANVRSPGQRDVELLGLPMTILCDIYVTEPDSLPLDAREFMDTLTAEENWNQYVLSDFNSVKWYDTAVMDAVNEAGSGKVLGYAFSSSLRAPKTAMKAFANLTHLVWGLENTRGFIYGEMITQNPYGIEPQYNDTLKFFFTSWRQFCNEGILKYAFTLLGPGILLLLFLAVSQLGGNLHAVFLVLAPMAYHFGTMLLLSGPDFRFFQIHYVMLFPLICIILMSKRLPHAE